MRKYAIKKPSNLKTILSIDEWTRNKAIKIIKIKTNEKIFNYFIYYYY